MDRIKPLLIFIALVLSLKSLSQEQLYYFTNADSNLVGVRALSGKTIIPLQIPMIGYYDFEAPITTAFIEFSYTLPDTATDRMNPNQSVGCVYDREREISYIHHFFMTMVPIIGKKVSVVMYLMVRWVMSI